MGVTNKQAGTRVDEVAEGIYRISTTVSDIPGGFLFNQYLLTDDQPLLFHTGPRRMHSLVQEAISSVLDVKDLRFIGFSHYESDECDSRAEFLSLAVNAAPLCGQVNALINGDCFGKPARALADGETLSLGRHRAGWFDTPHLPHAWECGYLMEEQTAHFCAATCSPKAVPIFPRLLLRTSLSRARPAESGWTTIRTRRMSVRSWLAWRQSSRRHSLACTVALGRGTEAGCSARSPNR